MTPFDLSGLLTSPISDAAITWTLPPPQRGPLLTSDSTVRTTIQEVRKGSSVAHLTWNFTLSGETLDRVIFQIGIVRIGKKTSSGIVSIDPTANFQEHFDISRSHPATLIIYNVTEADEAVFACSVETDLKTWTDDIEVKIVGKSLKSMLVRFKTFKLRSCTVQCCVFSINQGVRNDILTMHNPLFIRKKYQM